jgi:hypothetical protein
VSFLYSFIYPNSSFCDENDDGETDCRECTRAAAKIVLLIINIVWVIAGLGICAGGIVAYSWAEQFAGLIDTTSIIIVAAAGGFLFLVGILGCFSVFHLGCKSLQAIYGLLVFALAVIMAAAGAAVLSYTGAISSGASGVASADKAQQTTKIYIDNYMSCMYNHCCILTNKNMSEVYGLPSYVQNTTLAPCDGTTIKQGVCDQLMAQSMPPCNSADMFSQTLRAYINEYLGVFMIAVFGIAGLQFIGFFLSCCFILTKYTGGDKIGPYTA